MLPAGCLAWLGLHDFRTRRECSISALDIWGSETHGPDGTVYPNWIQWGEIAPPERLTSRHGSRRVDPDSFEATVSFADRDGRTEITLRALFSSKARRDYVAEHFRALEGGQETLERLEAYAVELATVAK